MTDKCPRCESPAPHLHPAMQFEGEVQPCSHPFHERVTPQNLRRERDAMNDSQHGFDDRALGYPINPNL